MRNFFVGVISTIILIIISLFVFYKFGKDIWYPYYKKTKILILKRREVIDRNITFIKYIKKDENLTYKERLNIALAKSNFIRYPEKITILAFKTERVLEVWGKDKNRWVHIKDYRWTGFSGRLGPKFKEGDGQIPEGIYGIEYLNPNSKFHLSMKINYPNSFDKEMAKIDNRKNLGGDIMIHGSNKTIGCIPIGDNNIEELYLLVSKVGIKNIKVIISPVDFRDLY